MEDRNIIALFNCRDEQAITEVQNKYGPYCETVAYHILEDHRDTEECVNDTWLHSWNSIPPQLPQCLRAFLGRITRNLALNRRKHDTSQKRGGGQLTLALEELGQCVDGSPSPEDTYSARELGRSISSFLSCLPQRDRAIFVGRYFYMYPVAQIAANMGMKEDYTANVLFRIRVKLKKHLVKEGYTL